MIIDYVKRKAGFKMERGYNIKGENEEKNVRNGDRKVKRRCFRFAWKIGTKFCYEFSSSIGKRQSVISNKSFKLKTKRLYLLFFYITSRIFSTLHSTCAYHVFIIL